MLRSVRNWFRSPTGYKPILANLRIDGKRNRDRWRANFPTFEFLFVAEIWLAFRLIQDDLHDKIVVLSYNFHPVPRRIGVKIWRLTRRR